MSSRTNTIEKLMQRQLCVCEQGRCASGHVGAPICKSVEGSGTVNSQCRVENGEALIVNFWGAHTLLGTAFALHPWSLPRKRW